VLGIVIVSHSSKVAEGVKDIAEQMNAGGVSIKAAGGADEDRIGTNPIKIKEAIEELSLENDVLVFVDLGSAVISTETALDMLEINIKNKVTIVDAPLVEGVVTAVIQASVTDDLKEIIDTAVGSKELRKL
jgi:phosphoenolpyruvate---glycerone phosphotransferase subunit DhaM